MFGENAQSVLIIVYAMSDVIRMGFRPYLSLIGPRMRMPIAMNIMKP